MAFDLATAKPVSQGFDLATAKPVKPKANLNALYHKALAGDPAARDEYNARAQAVGQPTIEQSQAENNPTEGGDNFVAGVGSALVNTGMGIKQLGLSAGNKIGLVDDATVDNYRQQVSEERALQAPLMDTGAGLAGNLIGNVALFANPATAVGGSAGIVGRYGTSAAVGGAQGFIQPVGVDESRIGNTLTGAALGLGGQGVGDVVGKVVKSAPVNKVSGELRDLWNKANAAGVELFPHQVTDSRAFKTIASVLAQLPLTGGQAANRRQIDQFTQMVSKSIGQDAKAITPEVQAAAKVLNKQLYDDALEGVSIPLKDEHIAALRAERDYPGRYTVDQKEAFNAIEKQWTENTANGEMSGRIYQSLRDGLKSGKNDPSIAARKILENVVNKNMPKEAKAAWDAAKRLYANRQVVKKALQGADTPIAKTQTEYKINPATFRSAVGTKYPPTKEIDAISRIGQIIKDPVPDSGTVGRALAGGALGGAGTFGGLAAMGSLAKLAGIGMVAGRAVNSRTLAKGLQSPALEALQAGTKNAIYGASRKIGEVAPRIAPAAGLVAMSPLMSPDAFNNQIQVKLKAGKLSKAQAAAQLDAYLQAYSHKNGTDSMRAVYKKFPNWAELMNY